MTSPNSMTTRYTVAFLTGPDVSTAAVAEVSAALAAAAVLHGFRIDEIHVGLSAAHPLLPPAARAADAVLVAGLGAAPGTDATGGSPPLFAPPEVPDASPETALLLAAALLLRDGLGERGAAETLAERIAASPEQLCTPNAATSGSLTGNSREFGEVLLGLLPSALRSPTIALGGSA